MFNPIFKENIYGGNIQGVVHLQNQNNLGKESLKFSVIISNKMIKMYSCPFYYLGAIGL